MLTVFVHRGQGATHQEHSDNFWKVLQYLHDHGDVPWPAEFPREPTDPQWEFCFHGTAMFVISVAPTHVRRRSRNLDKVLTMVFQPRNVFQGIEGGTPAGTTVRRRIRDQLVEWDQKPPHPSMGNYGDPSNHEGRQYVIPDDASEMYPSCPFRA